MIHVTFCHTKYNKKKIVFFFKCESNWALARCYILYCSLCLSFVRFLIEPFIMKLSFSYLFFSTPLCCCPRVCVCFFLKKINCFFHPFAYSVKCHILSIRPHTTKTMKLKFLFSFLFLLLLAFRWFNSCKQCWYKYNIQLYSYWHVPSTMLSVWLFLFLTFDGRKQIRNIIWFRCKYLDLLSYSQFHLSKFLLWMEVLKYRLTNDWRLVTEPRYKPSFKVADTPMVSNIVDAELIFQSRN